MEDIYRKDIQEHMWTYFVYNDIRLYICLYIFIYIFLYEKFFIERLCVCDTSLNFFNEVALL